MPILLNKFRNLLPTPDTEILFLGTFSPDIPDEPDFYFGRPRNFLWHLLPVCWRRQPLKEASLGEKQEFMKNYHIGFADIIAALDVREGEEGNTDDTFVDSHVHKWNDVIALINQLPKLKAVYFTRKTFNGISNMKIAVLQIAEHCKQNQIRMCKLETPARHFSVEKQKQWIDTIVLQKTCLRA